MQRSIQSLGRRRQIVQACALPFVVRLVALAGVLVARGGAAAAEPEDVRRQRVESGLLPAIVRESDVREPLTLNERMRFYKTPGFSVAVIHDGDVAWAGGYGVREAGTRDPVTPETVFQAASISKPVAAMVALRMVELGALDLDEDVNRRLVTWKLPDSEFSRGRKVTLRMLLSHRAGLTDHAGFQGSAPGAALPTLGEVLESGKWTPAPIRVGVEPDTRFVYSGGGYCLVEQLLEDVSGKPFPVLARELVLDPLGMTHSSFEQGIAEGAEAAAGHQWNGKRLPRKWNCFAATSAAGLWTTPTDLARFVIEVQSSRAGRSNKVLSQRMTNEMLSLQGTWSERDSRAIAQMESFSESLTLSRGLGVGLIGNPPTRLFHTGSNPGYQCELQAFVDGGQGAVVMSNAVQGWRLGREVLGSIAREYRWVGYDDSPQIRKAVEVDAQTLADIAGSYRMVSPSPTNIFVQISGAAGRLFVQLSDGPRVELFRESVETFFTIEDAMTLTCIRDGAGAVTELVGDLGWRARREPATPSP